MPIPFRPTPVAWSVTLLALGFISNLYFTCGADLVAFAVVAAATLPLRAAVVVALGVWFESQLLGFTVFAYPHEAASVAWGGALGAGTLVALALAARYATRSRLAAFVAAFAAYELALAAFAFATHGGLAGFTPRIVAVLFASNALTALVSAAAYLLAGRLEAALVHRASARRGRA